jgi:hypothetical protein
MRFYDWYMIDGESYSAPTASVPANYNIPWVTIETTSTTTAIIKVGASTTTPGSYGGAIAGSSSFNDPDFVVNTATMPYNLSGLNPGSTYTLRLRAYSGSNATGTYGEYVYQAFTMPKTSRVGGVLSTTSSTTTPSTTTAETDALDKAKLAKILAEEYAAVLAAQGNLANALEETGETSSAMSALPTGSSYAVSGNREVSRSIFILTNKYKNREKYALVTKNTGISTAYKKYAFGAGIFFESTTINPLSGGGIGFFTNSNGSTGYFVEIQTDSSNQDTKDKSIKIYKVVNGQKKILPDSQDGTSGKMYGGVIHSTQYKLDINVEVTTAATVIDVYINNFKISAADAATPGSTNPMEMLIAPTANFAMFSALNVTKFDYVYAIPLENNQTNNGIERSLYSGQYAASTINFLYGERLASNFNAPSSRVGWLEEFGTVARELRRVKVNFSLPAALPLYASTGVNRYASVLGSRFSNHGAEIYVLNNAGTFIPLQAEAHNFFVEGTYVSENGQHEYTETTTNEYTALEPASFQSMWIQSEADAKSLFGWIKNQWSKQQQSINMDIFGNPAIEVGDIITVNYPKNNLDGTQKFLVTNVNTQFQEGVSTSITARSIYS